MNPKTLILATAMLLAYTSPARARWYNDPRNGFITVAGTEYNEQSPMGCRLAGGRTFITWQRFDTSMTQYWMYYQVVDQFGNMLLPTNGIKLIEADWNYGAFDVLPDGQGGCITVFRDKRDGSWDIWGQRVDSLGNRLWGSTGLPLVIYPGLFTILSEDFNSDSLGNFFLSYVADAGSNPGDGIYTQKFNASGNLLWGSVGAQVSSYYGYGQSSQQSISDGAGGIIEVFQSYFSPGTGTFMVQHLNAAGQPLMGAYGMRLRDLSGQPMTGSLNEGVPDGSGGGVWSSRRASYPNMYIKVWRLNGQGQMQWLWTSENTSWNQGIISMMIHPQDGNLWMTNFRNDGQWILRFTLNGAPLFAPGVVPYGGNLVASGKGVISTNKVPNSMSYYSQGVDSNGTLLWTAVEFSDPSHDWQFYYDVCGNGSDGAVVAFEILTDWSSPLRKDIYAQRVNADGTLGSPTRYIPVPQPTISIVQDPQAGESMPVFTYTLSNSQPVNLSVYNLLGAKVATLLSGVQQPGTYVTSWDATLKSSGTYLVRLQAGPETVVVKVMMVK